MLIILEGAEAVGKTTAQAHLAEYLRVRGRRVETLHFGPPQDHPLAEYELALDAYDPADLEADLIVDRLHWSQEVYGPRYGGFSALGSHGALHIDKYLQARGALVVHLYDVPARMRERMLARHGSQAEGNPEYEVANGLVDDLRYLGETYWRIADASPLEVTHAPFGQLDPERVAEVAGELQAEALPLAAHPQYIGPRWPTVLLVGDSKEGASKRASQHAACFAPYDDCSGRHLLRCLPAEHVAGVGLVNSDDPHLGDLIEDLGVPRVVALGKVADARLAQVEAAFDFPQAGAAPHPQYMRRFHHHKPAVYAELLRAAARGQRVFSWASETETRIA